MNEFYQFLLLQGKRTATAHTYCRMVEGFEQWLKEQSMLMEEVEHPVILEYVSHRKEQGLKPASINHELIALESFYSFCPETRNPVAGFRVKGGGGLGSAPLLEPEDLEELYDGYPLGGDCYLRDMSMLGLLLFQGLTTREVALLSIEDLDLEKGKIHVPGSASANGRTLELKARQVVHLHAYQMAFKKGAEKPDKLFSPLDGGKGLGNVFSRISRRLKILGAGFQTWHQVRASVISHWLDSYSLREVQYMAGHKYVSSTEKYQVHKTEELRLKLEEFHPRRGQYPS